MTSLLVSKHDGTLITRVPLEGRRRLTIGRSHRCDLHLTAATISRRHALLFAHDGEWHLVDLGSRDGIHCGEQAIQHATFGEIDWARLGPAYLWLDGPSEPGSLPTSPSAMPVAMPAVQEQDLEPLGGPGLAPPPAGAGPTLWIATAEWEHLQRLAMRGLDMLSVGRAPTCDLTLADQHASRLHCIIYTEHLGWYIADTGSATGVRVGGRRYRRCRLDDHRIAWIGATAIWMEGNRRRDELEDPAEESMAGPLPSAFLEDEDEGRQPTAPARAPTAAPDPDPAGPSEPAK